MNAYVEIEHANWLLEHGDISVSEHDKLIEPFSDVEPVVRCKDCKWYDSERHDCPYMEEVLDDDYCSYGELKEQKDGKDTDSDSDM